MGSYDYVAELLSRLSPEELEKHGPFLKALIKTGNMEEACRSVGIHRGVGHTTLGRLRKKHDPAWHRAKYSNPLSKLGLTEKFALQGLKEVANSKRSPTARLKAISTILEKQAQIGNTSAADSQLNSQVIVIQLVASEEEFTRLQNGGKYKLNTTESSG